MVPHSHTARQQSRNRAAFFTVRGDMEDEDDRNELLRRAYLTAARASRGGAAAAMVVWVSLLHREDLPWVTTICESSESGGDLPDASDVKSPEWERGITSRDVREAVHRVHPGPAAVLMAELRARTDWEEIRTAGYVLRAGTGGPVPSVVSFPGRPWPDPYPGGRSSRRRKLTASSSEHLWATAEGEPFRNCPAPGFFLDAGTFVVRVPALP